MTNIPLNVVNTKIDWEAELELQDGRPVKVIDQNNDVAKIEGNGFTVLVTKSTGLPTTDIMSWDLFPVRSKGNVVHASFGREVCLEDEVNEEHLRALFSNMLDEENYESEYESMIMISHLAMSHCHNMVVEILFGDHWSQIRDYEDLELPTIEECLSSSTKPISTMFQTYPFKAFGRQSVDRWISLVSIPLLNLEDWVWGQDSIQDIANIHARRLIGILRTNKDFSKICQIMNALNEGKDVSAELLEGMNLSSFEMKKFLLELLEANQKTIIQ